MKLLVKVFAISLCFLPITTWAEDTTGQKEDIKEISQEAAKANKKLLVAANMGLSEDEKEKFWVLYAEYQGELDKMNALLIGIIEKYASNYQELTDDQAKALLADALTNEEQRLALKRTYAEKFGEILPYTKVARYFQIEKRLWAISVFDLTRKIPLVK